MINDTLDSMINDIRKNTATGYTSLNCSNKLHYFNTVNNMLHSFANSDIENLLHKCAKNGKKIENK